MKRWSSGAGHAEQYLVYGRVDGAPGAKGIGAVIVDRDAPGVSFGAQERMMGFHGDRVRRHVPRRGARARRGT